jgi:glycosyltransferase involved in cell wall biosynthesis
MTLRKYPLARLQLPFFLLRHSHALAHVARRCDLVHAHWTLSGGAAWLSHPFYRKPWLVTVHGSDIFQVPRHPLGAWLTRTILRRATRITAVSSALKAATCALGIAPAQVEVISNGIDPVRFAPPTPDPRHLEADSTRTVLFAGFLIGRKGVRYLVEALSHLRELLPADAPPYRLIIVGEGPEEAPLRAQVEALGLTAQVEFAGFQPQAVVGEWMRRATVFVLPSLEEGQGVVLLEALASGTPVIASDVDGMREVVTSEVGLRVPPADPPALARALAKVLTEREAWPRMSLAARQRAMQEYDWEVIGARFVELYRRVLASQ